MSEMVTQRAGEPQWYTLFHIKRDSVSLPGKLGNHVSKEVKRTNQKSLHYWPTVQNVSEKSTTQ